MRAPDDKGRASLDTKKTMFNLDVGRDPSPCIGFKSAASHSEFLAGICLKKEKLSQLYVDGSMIFQTFYFERFLVIVRCNGLVITAGFRGDFFTAS